jgi:hypothetical protein
MAKNIDEKVESEKNKSFNRVVNRCFVDYENCQKRCPRNYKNCSNYEAKIKAFQ